MDFTREPIIETVVSPRDGYKLLIRNSKEANQEEYLVNAVEIVSFGSALFFRCLEKKPKAFLLPIADYDVVEVKEARMVLKNISTDKPIKIAEGTKSSKENSSKNNKEESKTAESDSKKTAKKRHSRKRRSSKTAPEKDVADKEVLEKDTEKEVEELPVAEENETQEAKPASKKKTDRKGSRKTQGESKRRKDNTSTPSAPVVSVIFPPPPKIIGKTVPDQTQEASSEKEVFPEAVKEERKETEVASSKELPPLDEIKEAKEPKKSSEATSAKKGS